MLLRGGGMSDASHTGVPPPTPTAPPPTMGSMDPPPLTSEPIWDPEADLRARRQAGQDGRHGRRPLQRSPHRGPPPPPTPRGHIGVGAPRPLDLGEGYSLGYGSAGPPPPGPPSGRDPSTSPDRSPLLPGACRGVPPPNKLAIMPCSGSFVPGAPLYFLTSGFQKSIIPKGWFSGVSPRQ